MKEISRKNAHDIQFQIPLRAEYKLVEKHCISF